MLCSSAQLVQSLYTISQHNTQKHKLLSWCQFDATASTSSVEKRSKLNNRAILLWSFEVMNYLQKCRCCQTRNTRLCLFIKPLEYSSCWWSWITCQLLFDSKFYPFFQSVKSLKIWQKWFQSRLESRILMSIDERWYNIFL